MVIIDIIVGTVCFCAAATLVAALYIVVKEREKKNG